MSPKTVHIAGIAMAFFGWPGLVLLEEPFKRLKGDEIESLKNILVTLKEERAIAIVVSCDKVKQVEDIADHYGVFIDGNIEAELALEEVNVFSQLEMHIRVDNPKKALAIMKAHGAFGRDGWLILPEPKLSTGEVFSMLMKKKIGVYEITTKKLEKVDYFNQFTERAKGNIYE